jgi:hypothetical protein
LCSTYSIKAWNSSSIITRFWTRSTRTMVVFLVLFLHCFNLWNQYSMHNKWSGYKVIAYYYTNKPKTEMKFPYRLYKCPIPIGGHEHVLNPIVPFSIF